MDRQIVYPGAIPLETDILNSQKNAFIAVAKLAEAVFGSGQTLLAGLACAPTAPASMQVKVSPGQIFAMVNIDPTDYGSLAADTTHSILKQGLLMDAVNLDCPAPATGGFSINYLIQVGYSDLDANPVVLPYYNASNPAIAYAGPANAGTAQNTIRKGVCTVSVKAGVAAATGAQTTPAADAGYVGAWVVTVANGAATIIAGNITKATAAPFITDVMLSLNASLLGGFAASQTPGANQIPVLDGSGNLVMGADTVMRKDGSYQQIGGLTTSTILRGMLSTRFYTNARLDGGVENRIDISKPAAQLLFDNSGNLNLYTVAAGANPIVWTTGPILIIDGATGKLAWGSRPAFRGALVYNNTGANFASEAYDTDNIHDNATNPNRLTVPAGVTKVKITGQMSVTATATGQVIVAIRKNASTNYVGNVDRYNYVTAGGVVNVGVNTPVITVTAGDYFTVFAGSNTTFANNADGTFNWFAMEIVE